MSKDWRHGRNSKREYRGSKRFDSHCRNHGACEYCQGNRTHKDVKREKLAEDSMADLDETEDGIEKGITDEPS